MIEIERMGKIVLNKYNIQKEYYINNYRNLPNTTACKVYGKMEAYINILRILDENKANKFIEDFDKLPKPIM